MTSARPNDFPDWLPPVLVKELRQGLRTNVFTGVFVALQTLLSISMGVALTADPGSRIGWKVSMILLASFAIVVILIQPLRAVNALTSDRSLGTMETMSMARQSAMDIVFGKWVAISGQTTLLFCTMLPYVILRYFFGGMDLFREVLMLGILFLLSLTLTALTVGISGCRSSLVRFGMPVFVFPIVGFALWLLTWSGRFGGFVINPLSIAGEISWVALIVVATLMFYYVYSMLSLGASLIAPAAESPAATRRIIAMVLLLAMYPTAYFDFFGMFLHACAFLLLSIPALVTALTETAAPIASIQNRFARYGAAGKIVGIFLQPTRVSGLFFSLIYFLTFLGLALYTFHFKHSRTSAQLIELGYIMMLPAALLFPAIWQIVFSSYIKPGLDGYLKILGSSIVIFIIMMIIAFSATTAKVLGAIFFWHPLSFIFNAAYANTRDNGLLLLALTIAGYLLTIYLSALLGRKSERPLGAGPETMKDS